MRLHHLLTILATAAAAESAPSPEQVQIDALSVRLLKEAIEAAEVAHGRRLIEALATTNANALASSPQGGQDSAWGTIDHLSRDENEWDRGNQGKNEDEEHNINNGNYTTKPRSTSESVVPMSVDHSNSTIILDTNSTDMKRLPADMPSNVIAVSDNDDINLRHEVTVNDKAVYEAAATNKMDDSR
eukprot:scaffold10284_cov61-Cyclotella_meneghiniana.AAC.4